ncbi:hypothetical protein C1893_06050 [Pseudomonas sp. MPR-ANC1]|nr:hypothetical protein C1893_06050 [Pseudomonas sp. MPR-ANC1]
MSIDQSDRLSATEQEPNMSNDRPAEATCSNSYAIIRIRHKKSGAMAWRVFLYREGSVKVHKEFPFISHGGEHPAHAAAVQFRNEQMLRFPPPLSCTIRQKLRSSNTSGLAGVSRQKNGKNTYWIAQTTARDGKRLTRSFNVNTFGEEQAKQRAIDARTEQLATIEHRVFRQQGAEKLYGELLLAASTGKEQ